MSIASPRSTTTEHRPMQSNTGEQGSPARSVQQLHDLGGRVALVTGGSRGLGLQMAHALAEAGARVLITARKADELAQATHQLRDAGHDAHCFVADGSDEAQLMALADHALQKFGAVDILVNNAGAT